MGGRVRAAAAGRRGRAAMPAGCGAEEPTRGSPSDKKKSHGQRGRLPKCGEVPGCGYPTVPGADFEAGFVGSSSQGIIRPGTAATCPRLAARGDGEQKITSKALKKQRSCE